jgi:uncharacterized protein with HEPN domain
MRPDESERLAADRVRLEHMFDAAVDASRFVRGKSMEDLAQDRLLLLGVSKALEIIGEAARYVSEPTRAELRAVPWTRVVGMRHRVVHSYFDIDPARVYDTATQDLGPLIDILGAHLGRPERP